MTDADRGRVPFALVGVLLLVSSGVVVATGQPPARPPEPALDREVDRATAEVRAVLRDAVREASADAARRPVQVRADTAAGRGLNASTTFEDALRLRIAVAARERLETVDRRRGDVRVTASLSPDGNASEVRSWIDRVSIDRLGSNATAVRVRVENVTLRLRRGGRVRDERRIAPELEVATPVLALHDRVEAYQRRLDAGVTRPGLTRRLTAQLYALAWARGYAQYGGAPIENVIDNRHVSVATNAGLLSVQRETLGHADPDGRRTLARAAVKTAAGDVLAASDADAPRLQAELDAPTDPVRTDTAAGDVFQPAGNATPDRRSTRRIGVNRTASAAFLDVVEDGTVNRSVESVYAADVRLVGETSRLAGGKPAPPSPPGPGWTLVDERTDTDREYRDADVAPPAAPPGWHRLATYGRERRVERTRVRTWRRDDRRRVTRTTRTERTAVAVAIVGRHATSDVAPDGLVATAHDRGAGPLGGPNLADVRRRATERLVVNRGGPRAVLDAAAEGTLDGEAVRVRASSPAGIYPWIYRDLMDLRERVRSVSVGLDRREIGTFEANPPGRLASRLRDRRQELVDAPPVYGSAAEKAMVAARAAYLDRVIERLDERAERRRDRADRFDRLLRDRGVGTLESLRDAAEARPTPAATQRTDVAGPGGPVGIQADAAPAYLTRGAVEPETVPSLSSAGHPLVARNVNVFTVPYDDAADALVDRAVGGNGTVGLGTAARTLRVANATAERVAHPDVVRWRDELLAEVAAASRFVVAEQRATLARRGIGDGPDDRRAIVESGLSRWDAADGRALALANGSASRAVARAAADRHDLGVTGRDRLTLVLENRTTAALGRPAARPSSRAVERVRSGVQDVAANATRHVVDESVDRGVERVANRSLSELPSGLPIAPVPGYWYATMNVWHVTVRGEYARFGVRTDRGRPTTPGGTVAYVRDGSTAKVDVDDDGARERLGRSRRVSFDVSTAVVVVVPPGKAGVGDRDGNADERSAGWPTPGGGGAGG